MNAHRRPTTLLAALAAGTLLTGGVAFAQPPGDFGRPVADPPPANPPANPQPPPANPPAPDPANPPPAPGNPPPVQPPPNTIPLKQAWSELSVLEQGLKDKKKGNADLVAGLDAVANVYHHLGSDEGMTPEAFDAEAGKFIKATLDAYFKAYGLRKVDVKTQSNERDEVNVKAVILIGLANKDVTDRLITDYNRLVKEAKEYEPSSAFHDETFKALALMNNHKKGIPYFVEFIKPDNTGSMPDRIKAAHDSIILFKDVPGKERFELVDKMVTMWAGVEVDADQAKTKDQQAKKKIWDKVKASVVKALQSYTKEAKGADGKLLTTVGGFQAWLRDNKYSAKKDPWADPKPGAEPK